MDMGRMPKGVLKFGPTFLKQQGLYHEKPYRKQLADPLDL